ncbi:YaiI/YqxD family protein [Allorhodopirellula solitaria]|uniref:UPF0178 protein CA85_23030 n=1 Tax=Allorhodopirellula solitaria TaxID=2527987 RepID=A0A5C5Y1H6_9BACT|nr:YaiI/YqxD family protein [Allorhodopirellula solitaria]TWT67452.1 hypothetical protein CA85_23030 [Allorhodopirellula solitaria]
MKIWVDADAAPTDVKTIVFRAATRRNIETILVANQPIPIPPAAAATARSVVVREGADQADRYIVKHGQPMELAITADLPLAADLVAKGLLVIDPRGEEYSAANIASRLSMRNFMDSLRGTGVVTSGSAPYNEKDKKAFAATFDRLLQKATRWHQDHPDGKQT